MEETTQAKTLKERLKEEVERKLEEIKMFEKIFDKYNKNDQLHGHFKIEIYICSYSKWKMAEVDLFNKKNRKCLCLKVNVIHKHLQQKDCI